MFQIPGMIPPEEDEIDEMDDIDKVRDDLQSTKQLLAIELRYGNFNQIKTILKLRTAVSNEVNRTLSRIPQGGH